MEFTERFEGHKIELKNVPEFIMRLEPPLSNNKYKKYVYLCN
jgi:hypothetical protein